MRRYALTAEEFDGLAAGYGTADAHATLAAAQKSKRMLLLLALVDAASGARPRRDTGFDEALALFTRAQAAAPGAVDEVLYHPFFEAWASATIRRPADGLAAFAAYAAAAAARAGLPFRIAVPAVHGRATLPGLGTFSGIEGDVVFVEGDGHCLRAGAVRVAPPLTGEVPGWAPVRRLAAGIALDDTDPLRNCFEWRPADRLDTQTADAFGRALGEAFRLLDEYHPTYPPGIHATLRSLVPVSAPGGAGTVSAASRRAFGAVALTVQEKPDELALLLIHECRHMTLGAVLDLVDLYQPGGECRHFAPWRADPRPVGALLQGTYAHVGVTDFWRIERRRTRSAAAELEFAYWRAQTASGARSLLTSGELTTAGVRFVRAMAATLRDWQAEDIPAPVRVAAETMALATGVQWRLDNAEPDPEGIEILAAAWRRGADCPALRPAAIRPAAGAPARVPAAAERARRRALLGPDDPGAVTPPPDEADAWIALALEAGSGPLVERPELVRAVVLATGADARGVAGWITSGAARYRS